MTDALGPSRAGVWSSATKWKLKSIVRGSVLEQGAAGRERQEAGSAKFNFSMYVLTLSHCAKAMQNRCVMHLIHEWHSTEMVSGRRRARSILIPRNVWTDKTAFDATARKLWATCFTLCEKFAIIADLFTKNFAAYEGGVSAEVKAAGLALYTECLKDTVTRFLPYWSEALAPSLRAGRRSIIAAHGNTLRAFGQIR